MSQLAFWPLIDVRACVCVGGCVYWCELWMRWWQDWVGQSAIRCYSALTYVHTRTHTEETCSAFWFSIHLTIGHRTPVSLSHTHHTHTMCVPKCPQISHSSSPALTFTCSFCPFSFSLPLPLLASGAPAFHYCSRHFSAYTTDRVMGVCLCVSVCSGRVSMWPVDIIPRHNHAADSKPSMSSLYLPTPHKWPRPVAPGDQPLPQTLHWGAGPGRKTCDLTVSANTHRYVQRAFLTLKQSQCCFSCTDSSLAEI